MTSLTERPREVAYSFVLDRLASLAARASLECREPTCGARDEDGEVVSCSSENCGEKKMLAGWRRELQVMRYFKTLMESLERLEIERKDQGTKRGKR